MSRELFYVYSDESCTSIEKNLLIGGSIISSSRLTDLETLIGRLRIDLGYFSTFEWKKIRRERETTYKKFIDIFFNEAKDIIDFKSLILVKKNLNYKKYCQCNSDIGHYMFFYQLFINKFCDYLKPGDKCIVYLHLRNTPKERIEDFKKILNNGICKYHNYVMGYSRCVVSIELVDIKDHEPLQMTDVLLGGLGFCVNGKDKDPAIGTHKKDVSNYLIKKTGINNIFTNTPKSNKKFSIWWFRLIKQK